MADVEIEGLRELSADLSKISAEAAAKARPIIQKAALNIKTGMQDDARGSRHFRQIAPAISYDTEIGRDGITAEIGPAKDRYGAASLANLAYFGGANGGGGTLDIDGPLNAEEPRLMKALDDFLGGL